MSCGSPNEERSAGVEPWWGERLRLCVGVRRTKNTWGSQVHLCSESLNSSVVISYYSPLKTGVGVN